MGRAALLMILGLLAPVEAIAQTFTTRAIKEFNNALTNAGRFGVPRYTTAVLPICTVLVRDRGAVAFDTTTLTLKVCNGTAWVEAGGATVGGTNVFTGSNTFTDSLFFIRDNGDPTKQVQFEVSGLTTGNIVPFTVSGTAAAGILSMGNNSNSGFRAGDTAGFAFVTGTTTKITNEVSGLNFYVANVDKVHVAADGITMDLGGGLYSTASIGDPTVNAVAGVVEDSNGVTLTESAATTVLRLNVAAGIAMGGFVDYLVRADDATDFQARTGRVYFQVVNKAATETCVVSGFDGTVNPAETKDSSSPAASAGTLTYTWGVSTAVANGCDLQLTAVSSLTQTSLQIRPFIHYTYGPGTVGSITLQ